MKIDTLLNHSHFPIAATISTRLILKAAEELGVQWHQVENSSVFCLEYKGHQEYFVWQVSPQTSFFHYFVIQNKFLTKHFLKKQGISVPNCKLLEDNDEENKWLNAYEQLTKPLVVKPLMGEQGTGVSVNINNQEDYLFAVQEAMKFKKSLKSGALVEEMFQGKEYRILVGDGDVIAITHRIPANVVGDGKHTIQELIDQKNANPLRSAGKHSPLWEIEIDNVAHQRMAEQHVELTSVPADGQRIFLRYNSNLSTGGDSVDVTDQAHPSIKEIAKKTVASIPGLTWAGLDLMTTDLTAEQTDQSYVIIELNISPGISMQEMPVEGKPRQVAKAFIRSLFSEIS